MITDSGLNENRGIEQNKDYIIFNGWLLNKL